MDTPTGMEEQSHEALPPEEELQAVDHCGGRELAVCVFARCFQG